MPPSVDRSMPRQKVLDNLDLIYLLSNPACLAISETKEGKSAIYPETTNSSSINGAGGAGTTPSSQNAQIVAIDSKIEQAMDLVKTHLMFAVREEVESLRNKILELETTVVQLEAENSILREHVPSDILQNLALHSSSNGSGSSASTLMAAQ